MFPIVFNPSDDESIASREVASPRSETAPGRAIRHGNADLFLDHGGVGRQFSRTNRFKLSAARSVLACSPRCAPTPIAKNIAASPQRFAAIVANNKYTTRRSSITIQRMSPDTAGLAHDKQAKSIDACRR